MSTETSTLTLEGYLRNNSTKWDGQTRLKALGPLALVMLSVTARQCGKTPTDETPITFVGDGVPLVIDIMRGLCPQPKDTFVEITLPRDLEVADDKAKNAWIVVAYVTSVTDDVKKYLESSKTASGETRRNAFVAIAKRPVFNFPAFLCKTVDRSTVQFFSLVEC